MVARTSRHGARRRAEQIIDGETGADDAGTASPAVANAGALQGLAPQTDDPLDGDPDGERDAAAGSDFQEEDTSRRKVRFDRNGEGSIFERAATAREAETRRALHWAPAEILDEPPKKPGMSYRWISCLTEDGRQNITNVSRAIDEGWQPCRVDDVGNTYASRFRPISEGDYAGAIVTRTLMLMQMSKERLGERDAYFRREIDGYTDADDLSNGISEDQLSPFSHVSAPMEPSADMKVEFGQVGR